MHNYFNEIFEVPYYISRHLSLILAFNYLIVYQFIFYFFPISAFCNMPFCQDHGLSSNKLTYWYCRSSVERVIFDWFPDKVKELKKKKKKKKEKKDPPPPPPPPPPTHLISSHLGFVHPLQDVALHQCLPSSSVCCLPNPGGSLLLCYVILPSSAWSSSRPLPSPWLPLCASPCPPIVL